LNLFDKIDPNIGRIEVGGAPEGFDALILAQSAARLGGILHITRDDARMAQLAGALEFFSPETEVIEFPAWDCLPYDRVSPNPVIAGRRMDALWRLAAVPEPNHPRIVLTTVNAALQRVPSRDIVSSASFRGEVGGTVDLEALQAYLSRDGYSRTGTVREPGEYAVRGGIVDIYPPGDDMPLRVDLFGDNLESVRRFDPLSQLTVGREDGFSLEPVSEIFLDADSIARFRLGYGQRFGAATGEGDPLYEAVSAGRKHMGMEHWLPLFHEDLETLFDYAPGAAISLDHHDDEARSTRLEAVNDYYQARVTGLRAGEGEALGGGAVYRPLEPEELYLSTEEWETVAADRLVVAFSPFSAPVSLTTESKQIRDVGGKPGRDFSPERAQPDTNIFDAVAGHIADLRQRGTRVIIAGYTEGARDRLSVVLADHGIEGLKPISNWHSAQSLPEGDIGLAILGLEHGFEAAGVAVIGEQDILGDRLIRPPKRNRQAENFIAEASSLTPGDYVVHVEHGIGRFQDLEVLDVTGAPHDCVLLIYDGGDKLYIPVENIEVISRYGSEDAEVQLDKLGGSGWQARKSRAKKRIKDMADQLIRIAAERELRSGETMTPPGGMYDEFCARFPFHETEDQQRAIDDVIGDLSSGRPMDRLVCGDVGFGKTEVALRSAFVAVMAGRQVALIAPTTLLARQHFKTFSERFAGWPVHIGQLSRFVTAKQAAETKEGLAAGQVDIVIGTHALLAKSIEFDNLGLVLVDEEQHFGVAHKERLKNLRSDVHVLTLTATPIPRTLQLAFSGVRELSLIATPPVDRLAIRTFILPFDPVVAREAILREHYRGGQTFYVCPRISDIDEIMKFIREQIPEVKTAIAHGRMASNDLDRVMNAFYEGTIDVLISTNIVESGLDIPTANTLLIHRADMFGLSQLYQLRGRIGRSKIRGYAYFTLPPKRIPTEAAEKRLKVMQSLEGLGAGFSLASHDLDIRGAGNLLGEEQSGHIREVGIELYQQMLEEAVAAARGGGEAAEAPEQWTPQLNLGTSVLIPENYITDLDVRLGLYRRLSKLEGRAEIDAFAAELIDRFGPLPDDVEHLLGIVTVKQLCRRAGVVKLDAGPKGATVTFRENAVTNPAGLVEFISKQAGTAKLRPDQKLVYRRDWTDGDARIKGVNHLLGRLAEINSAGG